MVGSRLGRQLNIARERMFLALVFFFSFFFFLQPCLNAANKMLWFRNFKIHRNRCQLQNWINPNYALLNITGRSKGYNPLLEGCVRTVLMKSLKKFKINRLKNVQIYFRTNWKISVTAQLCNREICSGTK